MANHPGPESCGGACEGVVEALTGECAGQPLRREIRQPGTPTLLCEAEGHTGGGANRESSQGPTRSENLSMRRSSLYRNWEISSVPTVPGDRVDAVGGAGKANGCTPAIHAGEKSDVCEYRRTIRTEVTPTRLRRRSGREGRQPRRTPKRPLRPGRRAGPAQRRGSAVYVRQPGPPRPRARRYGSRRYCTTSRRSCCTRASRA